MFLKIFHNNKVFTKKSGLLLLLFLVACGLFLGVRPALALLDIPFNVASMQLGALDFVDNVILRLLIWLFLLAGQAALFLTVAAKFFDWSSSFPVDLGQNNLLVTEGWKFTSGLANVIFILIFVVIALSLILNKDAFGYKKALPRLIAVAFLVNFSLLFVKIFVDLGWLVQNAIVSAFTPEGGKLKLASAIIDPLIEQFRYITGKYLTDFGLYIVAAVLPFANVAKAIWMAYAVLSNAFLGTFATTIILIAFGFILGTIFLIYTVLFLLRIVIIWFLAIAAPLAFVAFILPRTQSYFFKWLHYLLEWTFLGAVVLFLAGLGIRLFATVAPAPSNPFSVGAFGGWDFLADYVRVIFLLIYLVTTLFIAKKFVPAGMNVVWAYGEKGIKAAPGVAKRLAGETAAYAGKKVGPQAERFGERMRKRGEEPAASWLQQRVRWTQRELGTGIGTASREAVGLAEKKAEEKVSANAAALRNLAPGQILNRFKIAPNQQAKAAALMALLEKDPKKYNEYKAAKKFTEDDELAAGKFLWDNKHPEFASSRASPKMTEAIFPAEMRAAASLTEQRKAAERDAEEKEEESKRLDEEAKKEPDKNRSNTMRLLADALSASAQLTRQAALQFQKEAEELGEEQMRKLIGAIKPSQVAQMSASSFEDPLFVDAILDVFGGGHMAEISRNFGREAVNEIQKGIDKIDTKEKFEAFAKKNPSLPLWLMGTAANNLGFGLPAQLFDEDPKAVRKMIKDARIASRLDRTGQKELLGRDYSGQEQMMFRDYYRPDISGERKSLIKEIVSGLKETLPTKEEISRSIGKLETDYQKLSGGFADSLKNLREAQEKYQKALAQGIIGPQLEEMGKVVDSMKKSHQTIQQKTEASMNDIEKLMAEKLKAFLKK